MNDGLPTLEMHRQLPVTVQAKHLFATNLIDDVVIEMFMLPTKIRSIGSVESLSNRIDHCFEEATSEIEKEIVIKINIFAVEISLSR